MISGQKLWYLSIFNYYNSQKDITIDENFDMEALLWPV